MPEYLAPGVYVEEFEVGAKPIEGVSTSTLGILGKTERGPVSPRLVTNIEEFRRIYGGFMATSYLPNAVEGFFLNGGKRCYVARITNAEKPAEMDIGGKFKLIALGPGKWGDRIGVRIDNAGMTVKGEEPSRNRGEELFKLTIAYWKDPIPEDAKGNYVYPPRKRKKKKQHMSNRRWWKYMTTFPLISLRSIIMRRG